jgi:hypothetical protein
MFKKGDKLVLLNANHNHRAGSCPGLRQAFADKEIIEVHTVHDNGDYFVRTRLGIYLVGADNVAAADAAIDDKAIMPAADAKAPKEKVNKEEKMLNEFIAAWAKVEKSVHQITHYAGLYADGSHVMEPDRFCAAGIGALTPARRGGKKITHLLFDVAVNHSQVKEDKREMYKRYIHYILNESPWADVFLTKSVDEALKVGVFMNLDYSVSVIKGASIALREGSEYQRGLTDFNRLLDEEVSPNAAYLACVAVANMQQIAMGSNHNAITDTAEVASLFQFFKDGVQKKETPFREGEALFGVWQSLFKVNADDKESFRQWIAKHLKTETIGEGFVKKTQITKGSYAKFIRSLEAALDK